MTIPTNRPTLEDTNVAMLIERQEAIAVGLEEAAARIRKQSIGRIERVNENPRHRYSDSVAHTQDILARMIGNLNVEGLPEVATEADILRAFRLAGEQA